MHAGRQVGAGFPGIGAGAQHLGLGNRIGAGDHDFAAGDDETVAARGGSEATAWDGQRRPRPPLSARRVVDQGAAGDAVVADHQPIVLALAGAHGPGLATLWIEGEPVGDAAAIG